jgi:hypothetical protein
LPEHGAAKHEERHMTFFEVLRQILRSHPEGMTPQQLRESVKAHHPEFYGTESQRRNVEKGHYSSIDHALLAQIYVAARAAGQITVDRSQKPMKLLLDQGAGDDAPNSPSEESIETENLEKLEAGVGTLYVLGTNLYTKTGEEILKIGITTGTVESRITQLYTTGVPFRFRVIKEIGTKNYYELEQSLHKLLDPYRINRSREFFTDKCLPYIEKVIAIHKEIHAK